MTQVKMPFAAPERLPAAISDQEPANDQSEAAEELWRPVAGFPGYEVSSMGRLRSWKPLRMGAELPIHPRELKLDGSTKYLAINLIGLRGERARRSVHRLVLEAFVGPCPRGLQACHNNGNARDNRASNLRWDTSKGNHADRAVHGTLTTGERNPNSKLNADIVREARAAGMTAYRVSKRWGVSEPAARDMLLRKTWKWVV